MSYYYANHTERRYDIKTYEWREPKERMINETLEKLKKHEKYCDDFIPFCDYTFGKLINGCPTSNGREYLDQIIMTEPNIPVSSGVYKLKIPNENLNVKINNRHIYYEFQYPFCDSVGSRWKIEEVSTTDVTASGHLFRISLETTNTFKYMYASRDKGNIYLDEIQNKESTFMTKIYKDQQLWEIIKISNNEVYIFNHYKQQFLAHNKSRNFLVVQDELFKWNLISL